VVIDQTFQFIYLLLAICFAGFTATIAGDKGYGGGKWVLAGLLFGPIALLAAVGLPDLKQRKYLRLLCEHYGVSADSTVVLRDGVTEDIDTQRRSKLADIVGEITGEQ
jgi:hypothetical protein